MVLMVKDIIMIFRKIKTIMILISLKPYFSHPEKSILKSSLTLRRHCNSGSRWLDPGLNLRCDLKGSALKEFATSVFNWSPILTHFSRKQILWLSADNKFCNIFLIRENKTWNFMWILCWQRIHIKFQVLSVGFLKQAAKFENVVCCKFKWRFLG